MKNINEANINEFIRLEKGEHFTYDGFLAIKINDGYAAFINADNKFIIAKAYKNCLSIGSGAIREFNSYAELIDYTSKITDLDKWLNF
jgi:hypothetical protein